MRADAPGKLVISGAYAVLRGAPAIVTAVNRRVTADGGRPADYHSLEVSAGLKLLAGEGPQASPPWYDASPLRANEEKLGLGSSAAICVASLGIRLAEQLVAGGQDAALDAVREKLYPIAREAHRLAQGGGSGIDVAAACFGGTLAAHLDPIQKNAAPTITETNIPQGLVCEVWASPSQASTKDMVKRVLGAETLAPKEFDVAMGRQVAASERALRAAENNSAGDFTEALRCQLDALGALGALAGVAVVVPEIAHLAQVLGNAGCFLPSGAGGGDVNLYFGPEPSPERFRSEAVRTGLVPVSLSVGAEGLRLYP